MPLASFVVGEVTQRAQKEIEEANGSIRQICETPGSDTALGINSPIYLESHE